MAHPSESGNVYPGAANYRRNQSQWDAFHGMRNEQYYTAMENAAVMDAIEPKIGELLANNPRFLKDPATTWKPADYLPDWSNPDDALDWIHDFHKEVKDVPDELWVMSIGGEITEDTLDSYTEQQTRLEGMQHTRGDEQDKPSILWLNNWRAQEWNHGAVLRPLHTYSGRVNMRAVETSVQALHVNGFNPGLDRDPIRATAWTAEQEHDTKIAHARVARLFKFFGADKMQRPMGQIVGEEGNHETYYTKVFGFIMEVAPEKGIIAFNKNVQLGQVMPGGLMTHGERVKPGQRTSAVFDQYGSISQLTGGLGAKEHVDGIRHFTQVWDIGHKSVTGEAQQAQEELFETLEYLEGNLDRLMTKEAKKIPDQAHPWVYGRETSMEKATQINLAFEQSRPARA